jgi:hypothetical protein
VREEAVAGFAAVKRGVKRSFPLNDLIGILLEDFATSRLHEKTRSG